jgi:hypothetical protein
MTATSILNLSNSLSPRVGRHTELADSRHPGQGWTAIDVEGEVVAKINVCRLSERTQGGIELPGEVEVDIDAVTRSTRHASKETGGAFHHPFVRCVSEHSCQQPPVGELTTNLSNAIR